MRYIAIILVVLILLGTFAFINVASAQVEEENTEPLKNIIERLKVLDERLREKLESMKEKLGEETYNELLSKTNEARQLLDKAEEACNNGDLDEAKQLLREAGAKYKEVIKEMVEALDHENIANRIRSSIIRCRRAISRLKRITERLKEKGVDTTEIEVRLNEAETYLNSAIEAFQNHRYVKAIEYYRKAWQKVKEAAEMLKILARKLLEQYKDKILNTIDRIENFLDKVEEKVRNSNMSEERKELILNKIADWRSRLENARSKVNEGKYEEAVIIVRRVLREILFVFRRYRKG